MPHRRLIDIVVISCAISAGIHGALAPEHLEEGTGPGLGFAVSTVLLAAVAVVLTRHASALPLTVAAALLAGLLGAYALALTTGLPVLDPETEAVDGLALFTKAVETLGLAAAVTALLFHTQPKGTTT